MNSKNPAFLPADSVPPAVETRSAEPAEAQARHCSRQSLALRCAPLGRLSAGPPVGGNTPLPTRGNPPSLDVIEALTYGRAEVGGSRFNCRPADFLKGTLGNAPGAVGGVGGTQKLEGRYPGLGGEEGVG